MLFGHIAFKTFLGHPVHAWKPFLHVVVYSFHGNRPQLSTIVNLFVVVVKDQCLNRSERDININVIVIQCRPAMGQHTVSINMVLIAEMVCGNDLTCS